MNCHSFSSMVMDLARGQLDGEARRQALAHAETCSKCAARLADERALTAGLRALAASQQAEQAPVRVEAALRLAFRRQAAPAAAPAVMRWSPRWRWALATVAALLLIGAVWVLKLRTPAPATAGRGPAAKPAALPAPQPAPVGTVILARPGLKAAPARTTARAQKRKRPPQAGAVRNGEERETEGGFLPLPYAPAWGSGESAMVVRGEMPRSALVSLGLPVNAARAAEPMKVDLVLGQDGVARAIRFVRESRR